MNNFAIDCCLIAASLRRDHVFWMAIVVLIASGSYLTYWAYQKRRSIWMKFAALHGLTYEVKSAQPHVHGKVDDRDFAMLVAKRSSDRGLFGIELIEMRLSIDIGIAAAFDITNEGAAITALREAAGDDEVVHISADGFDQRTCSHSDDSAALRRFLERNHRQDDGNARQ